MRTNSGCRWARTGPHAVYRGSLLDLVRDTEQDVLANPLAPPGGAKGVVKLVGPSSRELLSAADDLLPEPTAAWSRRWWLG